MANGTLQIRVSSSIGDMPVSGASVRISDALGNVVHTLYTDKNGLTMITLFAPGRKKSFTPYSPLPAYSVYEIKVTYYGYVPQIIRGVSIFEGVNSLLPIELEPRNEANYHSDIVNIIEIPPPSVSGRNY